MLVDLSLNFPRGELSLVCGKLGSGKSLLLLGASVSRLSSRRFIFDRPTFLLPPDSVVGRGGYPDWPGPLSTLPSGRFGNFVDRQSQQGGLGC